MGRKGKNNSRKRTRSETGRYVNAWRKITIDNALGEDEFRRKQSEFHKMIAAKEKDILSRSVFVTFVKDLNDDNNLKALERFFHNNYGMVKKCVRTEYAGKRRKQKASNQYKQYPPALVVFFKEFDAEKLFDGRNLLSVGQKSKEIYCPVGYKNGKILVRPCMPSNDLLLEVTRGSCIKFPVESLVLGHWCPTEAEMDTVDNANSELDVWLGVACGVSPAVAIDMRERCIELTNKHLQQTDRIMFKFKELSAPMKLCREDSSRLSIIFSLKQPPRVHRDNTTLEGFGSDYQRTLSWQNISGEVLGLCLGYKLLVSEKQIEDILLHEKYNQLRECGVLGPGFDEGALQNPTEIVSEYIGNEYDKKFGEDLQAMHHFQVGKSQFLIIWPFDLSHALAASLLAALRDSGKFTAYHAITSREFFKDKDMNIFDAIRSISDVTTIDHTMLVRTNRCFL